MDDTLVLSAASLCSKWGFCDGDILSEDVSDRWLSEEFGRDWWTSIKHHTLLCLLVERHLLPLLPAGVETYVIGGCHNPIRVKSVNGEEWDNYSHFPHPDLVDISARVSREEVVSAARELLENPDAGGIAARLAW